MKSQFHNAHRAPTLIAAGFFVLFCQAFSIAIGQDASDQISKPGKPSIQLLEEVPAASAKTSYGYTSFDDIKNNGLDNACYADADHYVAEFMYQNPDACYWEVNVETNAVREIAIPSVPDTAVQLPVPTGGDDTAAIQKIINANAGGAVVGQGTYRISNLQVNVSIDIFGLSMLPASGAQTVVVVQSPDVRFFNSPIDGENSKVLRFGYDVKDGADGFTLVKSGVSNIYHTNKASVSGILLRGVDDFYLACNTFNNIINHSNSKDVTSRANAIWMNGRNKETTSGGYIVNNFSSNLQSDGRLRDAEFFTIQSYASTDINNPIRIFGNRNVDAGKRFTKHQESDAKVLSNDIEWLELDGPIGRRIFLAHVEVHFSNNIIARNNRSKIGIESRFDNVYIADINAGKERQDNLHFDCNSVEIKDKLDASARNSPAIFIGRSFYLPRTSTGWEATNSTANNNVIFGEGSVAHYYWFGEGYDDFGGSFKHEDNSFQIPATRGEYKRDQ